jgi:hypothetical protein
MGWPPSDRNRNRFSYDAIEWYFPRHGQTFSRGDDINACTGKYYMHDHPDLGLGGSASIRTLLLRTTSDYRVGMRLHAGALRNPSERRAARLESRHVNPHSLHTVVADPRAIRQGQ